MQAHGRLSIASGHRFSQWLLRGFQELDRAVYFSPAIVPMPFSSQGLALPFLPSRAGQRWYGAAGRAFLGTGHFCANRPQSTTTGQLAGCGAGKYPCNVNYLDPQEKEEERRQEERQRLAETYAGMTDAELQNLALRPASLTEVAWEALDDELDRRNLELLEEEAPEGREELELRELVTIRQFRDLPEALLAKGSLESAGIECFLADENLVRLDWFISNFIGGIKLNVRVADVENARKILDEPILEGLYVQGVGLYEQPRCPKCQSLDVNFQELDRPIAYITAFLRLPMPVQRPAWRCHACDAEWEDESH